MEKEENKRQYGPIAPFSADRLEAFGVSELSDHDLVEAMVAARRLTARVQAVELAAVAELARRRFAEAEDARVVVEVLSPADYVYDEVAEALTLTAASADELIRFATELTGRLPGTYAALAAGDIDYCKARAIWHATLQLDEQTTRAIETEVLPKAAGQTTGQIRAKIRQLTRRLDPDAADRRRREAEKRRGVELIETDEGTAQLSGVDLPADAAGAAYGRLSAIATGLRRDGDDRTLDQLRADVFLGLLRGTFITTEAPADTTDRPAPVTGGGDLGWNGVDDAIADVIAAAANAGLTALTRDITAPRHHAATVQSTGETSGRRQITTGAFIPQASGSSSTTTSGELPRRHHDIAALITEAAERVSQTLADLREGWCVPATPPAHGTGRYRPPATMRRLIQQRDRRCVHPGCRRPVRHCDADHTLAFHAGGPTCPCNLAMLCRRHHRLKATHHWHIEQIWPGVILWITPTGHWKITAPADRE